MCTPAPRIRQNPLYEFVRIRSAFRLIDEFVRRQLSAFDNGVNLAKSALEVAIATNLKSVIIPEPQN